MLDVITFFGLSLNLLGTLLIAFSFGKNPGDAHQENERGRKIYLASFLYPGFFRWGLSLIAIGFIGQIIPAAYRLFLS